MTATDELRRLLDERGVEWWPGEGEHDRKTHWESNGLTWEYFNDDNGDAWLGFLGACEQDVSPEQAIAATLGPGTCKDATSEEHTQAFTCSECGCWVAYDEYWETGIYVEGEGQAAHIHPRYCPNCGRKVEA